MKEFGGGGFCPVYCQVLSCWRQTSGYAAGFCRAEFIRPNIIGRMNSTLAEDVLAKLLLNALHLGHLVGALANWKRLQEEYECFFMVADYHALMSEYERPGELHRWSAENVLDSDQMQLSHQSFGLI